MLMLAFTIALSFAAPAMTANPGLNTLLFYTCATKEVANQCEESYT